MTELTVTSTWPIQANAQLGVVVAVEVLAGDPLAFAEAWIMSSDDANVIGLLAPGEKRTFETLTWLISEGETEVDIELTGGQLVMLGTENPANTLGELVGTIGVYTQMGALIGYAPLYDRIDTVQEVAGEAVRARLVLKSSSPPLAGPAASTRLVLGRKPNR